MGQEVLVFDTTRFGDKKFSELVIGDYVAVAGLTYDAGVIGANVDADKDVYAAGATPVSVSGSVTAVDKNIGLVSIGTLQIDMNASTENLSGIQVGDYLEVSGVQPALEGVLLPK